MIIVVTLKSHHGSPGLIPRGEPNIFSLIASKLVCKDDRGGESWGIVQVASAGSCRMRGIEADCSWLKPGAWGEHLTSQLLWEAAWLLVICSSAVYLVVDDLRPCCVLWSHIIGLCDSVDIFSTWYGFTYTELVLF